MNIFALDNNPRIAAEYHCDKHVVKMILESAQLLSTAHRVLDGDELADFNRMYKATHKNHPSAIWVRASAANYEWTWELLVWLCKEYTYRYGKVHKVERVKLMILLGKPPRNISWDTGSAVSDFALAMPDDCKFSDSVESYRAYYNKHKHTIAKWNKTREAPYWFNPCI